jgi:hypothetical protein
VNRLLRAIRERAFVQYFTAYVSVSLDSMSAAFNMDLAQLERSLAELIAEGKIAARIDRERRVLHARHADTRHDTFVDALALGSKYSRDARSLLLRLSLVEHDMAVRGSAQEQKRKAAAAGMEKGGGGAAAGQAAGLSQGGAASARGPAVGMDDFPRLHH